VQANIGRLAVDLGRAHKKRKENEVERVSRKYTEHARAISGAAGCMHTSMESA
jgi:hypothetical protein